MPQSSNIGSNPTTAPNVDFGRIMNQGLDRLAQNEERERLQAEREARRNAEFEDRYGIDEDLFVMDDTEFRTVNDATTEAVSLYRDRYYDVYQKLKSDPNNIKLKKRLGNISNSVKRMSASHAKIKDIGENYLKMLENDELSGVDEESWRDRLEATENGQIKINVDDEDRMQILFYKKNENGESKLQEVMPYRDLIAGNLYKKVNLDEELDGLVESVGRTEVDTVNGGFIKTSDEFGQSQKRFVNEWVDSYLGTDKKSLETNAVLADLLNQATGGSSKKRSNFTEQERQYVRKWLMQQTQDRFDEKSKLKNLPQPRAAAKRKGPKAEDINLAFSGDEPTTDGEGNFVFTISQPVAIDPTKSDRKIDTIKSSPSGELMVSGEDRIKIKGVQDSGNKDDEEIKREIAKREGVPANFVEQALGAGGEVQYYKRSPFEIKASDNPAMLNKIGNIFGVQDERGLRNILYQDLIEKFGKEEADRIIKEKANSTSTPKQSPAVPKEVKSQSGNVYK